MRLTLPLHSYYHFNTLKSCICKHVLLLSFSGNIDQIPWSIDESLLTFGCQTLQDLQHGKLEVSPLEITINSTSMSSMAASKPAPSVVPASEHNWKPSSNNQNRASSVTALPSSSTTVNNLPKYGIVQTLPDGKTVMLKSLLSGQQIFKPKSKVPTTSTYTHSSKTCTENSSSNSIYTPSNSIHTPGNSSVVPNCVQEQNVLFLTLTGTCSSAHAPAQKSERNPGIQTKPINTPSLNMVIGKENVGGACGSRAARSSQPHTNNKRLPKGKKRGSRTNLSQRSSPAMTAAPPPVIKTEPVSRGVYGRVKNCMYYYVKIVTFCSINKLM